MQRPRKQTHCFDLDNYLRLHGEELSAALRRQNTLHFHSMEKLVQQRASALMRQKEEEFAIASQTKLELEGRLQRLEEEKRTWKNIAEEAETSASVLNCALSRVLERSKGNSSHCEGDNGGEKEKKCRVCGRENLKVILVPCMHLSACSFCGPLLASCPVCNSAKQDIIEVFLP